MMKQSFIKLLLAYLLVAGQLPIPGCLAQSRFSGLSAVPGTTVYMQRPAGFTPAKRFSGFKSDTTGASVMVTEMPGPYAKITAGFNSQGLKTRGMTLISRQQASFGDRTGLLVHVSQAAYGRQFLKWIGAFGTENKTVLITATFPQSSSKNLSNSLRNSVLSATWNPSAKVSPTAHLTYSVSPLAPFKLATRIQNSILFTISGTFPQKSPDQPVFIAAEGMAPVHRDSWESFAHKVITNSARLTDVKETSFSPVTIGGLTGFESSAVAKDIKTGNEMYVYQVVLYTMKGYYRMQGQVAVKEHAKYEEYFKQLARTFTRT